MYFKSTGVSDKFVIMANKIFLDMIIYEPMFYLLTRIMKFNF